VGAESGDCPAGGEFALPELAAAQKLTGCRPIASRRSSLRRQSREAGTWTPTWPSTESRLALSTVLVSVANGLAIAKPVRSSPSPSKTASLSRAMRRPSASPPEPTSSRPSDPFSPHYCSRPVRYSTSRRRHPRASGRSKPIASCGAAPSTQSTPPSVSAARREERRLSLRCAARSSA